MKANSNKYECIVSSLHYRKTEIRRHLPSLGCLRIVCCVLYLRSVNSQSLSLNHHLAILDKYTLLCLLHTTAREVENFSFHFSVFTLQFVNTGLLWGESNNLAETAPRRSCLITVNRSIRHMQGGILYIITIKCIAPCRRDILGIAIDIKEFGAIAESPLPYALHTTADRNRGQTIAKIESIIPYARHTIGDSNRGQTRAIIESIIPYKLLVQIYTNLYFLCIFALN